MCGDICPICQQDAVIRRPPTVFAEVTCPICGDYTVYTPLRSELETNHSFYEGQRHVMSGLTRRASHRGAPLELTSERWRGLLAGGGYPKTPVEKMNELLLYIQGETTHYGERVTLDLAQDYPFCFAHDRPEAEWFLKDLERDGHVEVAPKQERRIVRVTMEGWKHAHEIRRVMRCSNRAFVAMSFSGQDDIEEAFANGLKKGLGDCGYDAFRVMQPGPEHRIDNVIMAEIRRSGLMLADFTEQKQNVYYEAGFAQGLGIPVVKTCRKDELDKKECHFDTRQYYHIAWEPGECEELRKEVAAYIDAHGLRAPAAGRR